MESAKILIVDDEPNVADVLQRALSKKGYVCETAADGYKALERSGKDTFDLLITDLCMPGLDGQELIRLVLEKEPDKAIVVVSANSDIETVRSCLHHGVYDYITKPFSVEDVYQTVQRALERSQLLKQVRDYQANLERRVREQAERIKQLFINAVASLINALEAKDHYIQGHSQQVTHFSVKLAEALSLMPQTVEEINLSAQLHDIGKIGIKESILNKPDKLTEAEYEHIQQHPVLGEKILKPIIENPEISRNVRHHHERVDGKGYPDNLSSEEIPLGAKIISLADAFDAMTSERPYRKKLSIAEARREIAECAGSQFDPEIAGTFLRTFKEPA